MEKLLYGYVEEDEDDEFSNMMIYGSIKELNEENNVGPNDHIYIFQLIDEGKINKNPQFVSNKKTTKSKK